MSKKSSYRVVSTRHPSQSFVIVIQTHMYPKVPAPYEKCLSQCICGISSALPNQPTYGRTPRIVVTKYSQGLSCLPYRTKLYTLASRFAAIAAAAKTIKIFPTSQVSASFTSVSMNSSLSFLSPFVTPFVAAVAEGNRPWVRKYSYNASFSYHRSRSQRSNLSWSSRGMSAMARRRQYMFTEGGGRPWRYMPLRV
jgi:hypothetical protein